MGEARREPPQLFNFFKLPFAQWDEAQKIQDASDRLWRANEARAESFSRAQQGGN